jgi:hypothetical protein
LEQVPFEQIGTPASQAKPQALQFCGSVFKSTRQPFIALPPHTANPGAHTAPQAPPSQVGTVLGGWGQGVQELPHDETLVFESHAALHAW